MFFHFLALVGLIQFFLTLSFASAPSLDMFFMVGYVSVLLFLVDCYTLHWRFRECALLWLNDLIIHYMVGFVSVLDFGQVDWITHFTVDSVKCA